MKKILLIATFLLVLFWLSGCNLSPKSDDIINPDADYVYFYGKTCPHCQELNAWMSEQGTHEKYVIEKREVYFNPENSKAFQAVTKALGLEEWSSWVPFMLRKSDKTHYIWVQPIQQILP